MPRISEFFGIVIYMYWYDIKRHKMPHFHAEYDNRMAVFDFKGNLVSGNVGNRAARLVAEWALERHEELYKAWQFAIEGKEIPWIKPIK